MGFSALLVKSKHINLDAGKMNHGKGAFSELIHSAEGMAMAEGYGYLHGRYRESMHVPGTKVPLNLAAGVVGKFAAIGLDIAGHHRAATHLNIASNVGLYTYAFADGVSRGTKAAGVKIFLLPSGKTAPAAMGDLRQTEVVGEIPRAVGGDALTDDELAEMSRARPS